MKNLILRLIMTINIQKTFSEINQIYEEFLYIDEDSDKNSERQNQKIQEIIQKLRRVINSAR
ncbi:MAG: hypothetical protein Tsb0015_11690 [Simkaniaceae bacterium]